jgi:uncharacterized repeat protein (TIGR03803 family)
MIDHNFSGGYMTSARHACYSQSALENCLRLLIAPICVVLLALGFASQPLHSQTYTDLHDFQCPTEGCRPSYPAILAQGRDGNLYGTMSGGGKFNFGSVFKITPSGAVTTLYDFNAGGSDGFLSVSGLILGGDGNFYGTTYSGGANNAGTFFKITPAGALTTLHSFTNTDGFPVAPPIQGPNGNYYGITSGNTLISTAYSMTPSGTYKLLNPALPGISFGPMIVGKDGNFYGTTESGGVLGAGTVFRMSPTGVVKIIYNFDGHANGGFPQGPVVQGNDGFLYGTTSGGGLVSNPVGVVFKLSTGGKITVLHSFDAADLSDGKSPYAGLVAATDGNFYGGSSGSQGGLAQYGALFKITKSGSYSVQHLFDFTHGQTPSATAMQHTNGVVYGLSGGGSTNSGVFYSLAVGIPSSVSLMPTSGTAGQTIGILGNGFNGTTSVTFGSASASFNVVTDTYMTAVVPASGTTAVVTVTAPSGALKSRQIFKVLPVVSSFSPASGPVGTQVTITGSGLIGASQVTFGGVKATAYSVDSGSQIRANVPAAAKTGKIAVKTAGGNAPSKAKFTVTP